MSTFDREVSTRERGVTKTGMSPVARRALIYAVVLPGAFLLGLVPMRLTARERGRLLEEAQRALTLSRAQNQLSAAAHGAAITSPPASQRVNFSAASAPRWIWVIIPPSRWRSGRG